MSYYRVRGEVLEVYEEYIEANDQYEAIINAQYTNDVIFNNDVHCEEISEEDYLNETETENEVS
jgi:hypothetical protein